MTPWKWNNEIKLWVNSVDGEKMTAIEYDSARCKQIAKLESTNAALLEACEGISSILTLWLLDPSKAPNTLVTCIQAITEPAIRKAKRER